jgi:hypothetical protein
VHAARAGGRKADLEGKLAKVKARLLTDDDTDALIDTVREIEKELKKVNDAIAEDRAKSAVPASEAWAEFTNITEALAAAPDQNASRLKLRGAIRRVVESIGTLFTPGPGIRPVFVQVTFTGGKYQTFVIVYRPRHVTRSQEVKSAEYVVVDELGELKPDTFDLRRVEDAKDLEEVLAAITPEELESVLPTRN